LVKATSKKRPACWNGRRSAFPAASFSADPCSAYNENGDITLSWSTSYAKTVHIDQGIGEVAAAGSLTIPSPESPKVYTLTALNDAAATIRRMPSAPPNPGISLSPNVIEPTHSAKLNWNCGCAATCEIDQGIGKVSGTGSMNVSPLDTTTYTISTSNAAGQRSKSATLTVRLPGPPAPPDPPPAPYIHSFSGTPSCDWSPGIPITLSWSSSNANNCEISPGVGQVSCNGSIQVNPDTAGTYTLIARGDGGVHSRSFTFPPKPTTYRKMSASPSGYVKPGDEVTLSWWPTCADTVTISGIGEVAPAGGSMPVIVPDSLPRTYTMTATNEAGSTSYSITLYYYPPAGTFTTDDSVIKVGESAVLRWTSQYADTCAITPNVGEVDCAGGAVTVTPDKPTTYSLTLKGWGGTKTYNLSVNFVVPDVDIQATPETIKEGESTTLSWVFSNATSCSIDHGIGEVQLGQTLAVSPTTTTAYTITATGPGGTRTDTVTVNVTPKNPLPTATLTVNPAAIWNGGESTLAWSTQYADTVTITPDIGTVAASGSRIITPAKDTTYTLTASGPGGTATAQARITVLQYAPVASLTATPENIELDGSSTLSWTTEHADTVTITPDIGTVAASGSREVTPAKTTTYTLTAKGSGGTAIARVTVSYPVPTVTLTAEPATINYPGTATLSWTSTNATAISISPNIGTVEPGGTLHVAPQANTTYTITATGPGGSATSSVTVQVVYPPPTAAFSAEPDSIAKGESAQLTWSAEYADSCAITPLIGPVECNGSRTVTPAETTLYTFTVTGPGGSVSRTASVKVIQPPPTVAITADPASIEPGGSAILQWSTTDADSVIIDQGIGEQPANGQITVFPNSTTTYTVTATGPGGSANASVTITVAGPGPITLTITSPEAGITVHTPEIMILGTVVNQTGNETGIIVNGAPAQVNGNQFFANSVPLIEGENTISVSALDTDGNKATATTTINLDTSVQTNWIELQVNPASGVAPMAPTLTIDYHLSYIPTGRPQISYEGPDNVEFTWITDTELTIAFQIPGIYTLIANSPTLKATRFQEKLELMCSIARS